MQAVLDERLETDWERRWLPAADACIVASEHDRRVLAERVPYEHIDVVPPGVDEQRYTVRRTPEPGRLVFVGRLAGPSHLEAARRLATRVLPRVRRAVPGAELVVAGSGPRGPLRALAALPGVRAAGATTDVRPSLWSATVALIPAEAAPGVDAAMLEAMALGTPVVTSRRCLSGLDHLIPGHHLITADSDAELADAAVLVLREPVVATTLAANARQVVQRAYSWSAVADAWESLWRRAVEPRALAVAA
jgi:glycosyltransferase involved in cell wall biosynthesis